MRIKKKVLTFAIPITKQPLTIVELKVTLRFKNCLEMDLIKVVEQAFVNEKVASYPKFKGGDTITVTYRIKEGDKERLQKFRGVVLQISGATPFTKTFTVRKISGGVGVERIFPFQSPFIDSIEVNKVGHVRRARIFYLRNLSGKKARIKEKKLVVLKEEGATE